jgi:hypothetical protein
MKTQVEDQMKRSLRAQVPSIQVRSAVDPPKFAFAHQGLFSAGSKAAAVGGTQNEVISLMIGRMLIPLNSNRVPVTR